MEAPPNRSLTSELIGDKSQIRKLFITYKDSWINIKAVVNDYYAGNNNYTAPFKYALSIIAPYVIILNVIDYNVAGVFIEALPVSPEGLEIFDARFKEIYSYFINVLMVEFLPLFYALITAPVTAFYFSKFFKRPELNFTYYYAFVLYVLLTISTITFLIYVVGIYMDLNVNNLTNLELGLSTIFLSTSSYKLFGEGIFKSVLKSVAAFTLSQITITIPLLIILVITTLSTM